MRIVFMGTPDFSVPALETLIASEHQVVGVVTQPDKPRGRGNNVQMTPVKKAAVMAKIPVFQPVRLRDPGALDQIAAWKPDAIVVVAFGQILRKDVLELPKYGCFNIHASLLPKFRGAAPIQQVILEGEKKTGVTIQQMDEGIDTGDILAQAEIVIDPGETGGSLHDKLAVLGGPLLLQVLRKAEQGILRHVPQNEAESSYYGMLHKKMGLIDWEKPAAVIERMVRGLNPWPSAFTFREGKSLKIWKAAVVPGEEGKSCGTVLQAGKESFTVQTGEGALEVLQVQMEGKRRMSAGEFLRGFPMSEGEQLG